MTDPWYNSDLPAGFIIDLEFDHNLDGPWKSMELEDRDTKSAWSDFELLKIWLNRYMQGPYILKCCSTAHWAYNLLLCHPADVVWVRTHCTNAKKITESHGPGGKKPQRILSIEDEDCSRRFHWEQIMFGSSADMKWVRGWLRENPHSIISAEVLRQQVLSEVKMEAAIKNRIESLLHRRGINLKLDDLGI